MSNQDLEKTIQALETLRAKLSGDASKAHAFLIEAGIAAPSGELTENYKASA